MKLELEKLEELNRRLDRHDMRLRAMQGIAASVFWTCPYPSWVKSPNGSGDNYWVMTAINAAYEKAFKVNASEYLGRPDHVIWPADVAAQFRLNDMAVRDAGRLIRTYEKFNLDGNEGPHLVVKWPVYEQGVFSGVAGIAVGPTVLEWVSKNGGG